MTPKQSIAFIESNTTGTGEEFIKSAIKLGFNIIFITTNPQKYKFLRDLLIYPTEIDTSDADKIYNYLKQVKNLKSVISSSESFVYNAAIVAKRLSLLCNSPESIQICRDKFMLAHYLSEAKIPNAKTNLIKSTEEAVSNLSQFEMPVILKPNIGTGSIGVKLCHSKQEIILHLQKFINDNDEYNFLMQEYIIGEEFSAEIIAINGKYHFLGITKKYLGNEPYFVENGHDFPASIDKLTEVQIHTAIGKALNAVDFYFGPAHVEFRIRNKEIYIIEINPRLAGGMIPMLIESSQDIALIENIIKLYSGEKVNFIPKNSAQTRIEFLISEKEGILQKIPELDNIKNQTDIINIHFYKKLGDEITIKRDFSDRLGFIIAKASNLTLCKKAIEQAAKELIFSIETKKDYNSEYARGRLQSKLDPRVKLILEQSSFIDSDNLSLLSKINKVHLLMLRECNIISEKKASLILEIIENLEKEKFNSIIKNANNPEIGYYLAFEQYLIDKIGVDMAGAIHTGRSRNDINVTIQRLKSRKVFVSLYSAIWNLRSTIIQIAQKNIDINMPIYSQYQPAMPATYAYYLLAVENSLAANAFSLQQMREILYISPLGACSGAGTSFPIDPTITAKELGFKHTAANALHVIASRDPELSLLSIASIIGGNISRVAHDYQLWSTNEFNFFDIPDSLCGISSAMPQKKNPYLLEKIKGKAISISGKFFTALSTVHKTPFSNSLEVGTEAFIDYLNSFDEIIKSIKLLELIIEKAIPIKENMMKSNVQGLTVSTIISEELSRKNNITFREAHNIVGELISEAINNKQNPVDAISKLCNTFNIEDSHNLLNFGGGPSDRSVKLMIKSAKELLNKDSNLFHLKSYLS
jgi:argininosuccinate lyase